MTQASQRQTAVLAVLVIVLAVVVWKQVGAPAPATATAPRPTSNPSGRTAAATVSAAPDVQIERLTRADTEGLQPSVRNPFRFRERPASPSPRTGPVVSRPMMPQAPVVSGPPPLPPIPLRFIGVVEPKAGAPRIAVFASTDVRGDVLYGKEGDIIEGRYRVLRVGPDTAELSYLDGRGRQTIRLSGQ